MPNHDGVKHKSYMLDLKEFVIVLFLISLKYFPL